MKNKYGINSENYELIKKLIGLIYHVNDKTGDKDFNRETMEACLIGCDFPTEIWNDAITMVESAIKSGLDRQAFQYGFEGYFEMPFIDQPYTVADIRRNFRKKVIEFIKLQKAGQKISRKLEKAEAESAGAHPEAAIPITGKLIEKNPAWDFLMAHGLSLAAARPESFEYADNFFIGCLVAFDTTRTNSYGAYTACFAAPYRFESFCKDIDKIATKFLKRNRGDYFAKLTCDTFKAQQYLGGWRNSYAWMEGFRKSTLIQLKKLPKKLHKITHRLVYYNARKTGGGRGEINPMPKGIPRLIPAGLIIKTKWDADFEIVFEAIEKLEGENKRKAFAALKRFQNVIKWGCYINWWVRANWPKYKKG